jgi:hypothetical protein
VNWTRRDEICVSTVGGREVMGGNTVGPVSVSAR